ncbi:MAG: GAF domain-containing protein, partial [Janthinobacterium lividum]
MPPFARLQNSVAPNGQFGIRQSPDPFGTEADRIAALHTLMVLDTAQEESYDDITCLTARLCDVPIALISLVDEDRQWFKSRVGLDVCETAREFSFCSHAIQQPELFIVPDAAADPRFADNPFVAGDPYIRFYAGVPLVTTEGHALGSLCVIDRQPRILTDEQKAILKMLARQVIDRIELNGRAVLQKQLVAQQEGLLAEKERLIAEHKQTELALRQSEEELQAVVDQAMDGIYVFDPVTKKVLKTNVAFREMLDYSEEQAGSLTLYDIIGHTKASIDRNVNALTAEVKMIVG